MSIIKQFKFKSNRDRTSVNFLDIFIDSDSDGLSDWEEKVIYKTDPYNPDTSGDGIKDGDEVKRGRNPLKNSKLHNTVIPNNENDYIPSIFHFKKCYFLLFLRFLLSHL